MTKSRNLSALLVAAIFLPMSVAAFANNGEVYGPPAPQNAEDVMALVAPPSSLPPALVTAAQLAAQSYPTIRNAEAQLRASRSDVRAAKWLRFPSLSVEALAVTRGTGAATQDTVALNATAEAPIYTFGRVSGTINKAEALRSAREAAVDESVRDLTLRVINAYYSIGLSAQRQAVLEEGLAQHQLLLETIRNRVNQEVSPMADLDLAIARTAELEQQLAQAKAQRAINLSQLYEMVGTGRFDLGNVPIYDPDVVHPTGMDLIDEALACDPKLARLRAEMVAAEADAKVAKAGIFPQLLGQVAHNEITGTRVGVVLRAQTGAGLSQLSAAQSARARVEASAFDIQTAERELRDALQLDLVTNSSSRDRIVASATASETSELVTASYRRQFIAGRRTWLDVMNAVREATSSELSRTEAEFGAMSSHARILLRTCRWQPQAGKGEGQE